MTTHLLPATIAQTGLFGFHGPTFLAMGHSFFADFSNLPWVAIIAICGGFLVSILVPICAMFFQHQKKRLWHETARIALEKGQPLPPMSGLDEQDVREVVREGRGKNNDLRAGLILIGVGAGLYLFFVSLGAEAVRFVGAIPGFIGVALLLHAMLEPLLNRKDRPPTDRPPQS